MFGLGRIVTPVPLHADLSSNDLCGLLLSDDRVNRATPAQHDGPNREEARRHVSFGLGNNTSGRTTIPYSEFTPSMLVTMKRKNLLRYAG